MVRRAMPEGDGPVAGADNHRTAHDLETSLSRVLSESDQAICALLAETIASELARSGGKGVAATGVVHRGQPHRGLQPARRQACA